MATRRVILLGIGVTALVVLAGAASRGRPLAGSGPGAGPSAGFFDYSFTTIIVFAFVVVGVVLWSFTQIRRGESKPRSSNYFVSTLMFIATAFLIAYFLRHSHFLERFQQLAQQGHRQKPGTGAVTPGTIPPHARGARVRWDEIVVFVVLALGAAALVVAARLRDRRLPPTPRDSRSKEALSFALDESLDDLRNDPDLRRAIIAAYARMETALAYAGLPRRPSEAPLEYMERALTAVDASAPAAHRLTELFEWAKFSHHEPEPRMRDEAIAALVAVRDELRQPAEAVAA
jgi:hypothetical protein